MRCALLGLVVVIGCGEVSSRTPSDAAGAIDSPPAGPATITFTHQLLTGVATSVDLVAFQDGDGPWQVASGTAGVYTTTVTTGRYGVMYACKRASDGATFVNLAYYAVSDGARRYGISFCTAATPARVKISGTVAGAAASDQIFISDGVSSSQGPPASWSMPASAGPGSLVAARLGNSRAVGLLLQRVQFAEGAMFALDFAQQFFPAESALTLDPTAGMPFMLTSYIDENGGDHRIDIASSAVTTYRVMPADRVGNGISVLFAQGSTQNASRSIQRAFKTPVAQTMTLPIALVLSAPPQVIATTPYPIIAVALPKRAGASYYSLGYNTFLSTKFQIWSIVYSAAWADAAGGSAIDSKLPDLSALPGWLPDYALGTTGTRSWNAAVATGPDRLMPGAAGYTMAGRLAAQPADGDEVTMSSANGSFP